MTHNNRINSDLPQRRFAPQAQARYAERYAAENERP